jgi:Holliday junction DNA helicase RuvA
MIGSLKGILVSKSATDVLLDVSGVGYQVSVPLSTLSELPETGTNAFLHIYTHVREDALQLFGFLTQEEKRIFITLLSISGIGPRVALNIISGISHDDFLKAVESEDITLLTRVPGLGKKTAHRIVLELKGKLPRLEEPTDRLFDDALSALVNLGYRKTEAIEALEQARKVKSDDIESLLRESLKYLTGD